MNSLVIKLQSSTKDLFSIINVFYRLLYCFWGLPLLWLILAMEAMAMGAAMATEAMGMVVMVEDIMEREMLTQRL